MGEGEIIVFLFTATIVFAICIAGIFLFIFQYRKRKIIHLKETEMLNETHSKELLSTQLEMQQQTMQFIGREIHDNVGQKLTLASLYTQQLAYENKVPQIKDTIETFSTIINESLADLRQLSKSLTDDGIENKNIVALIETECNNINQLKKCKAIFNHTQLNIVLPYQTKSILLRIVQEFLQNSIKHANCKSILINLDVEANELKLQLKDDGIGFIESTSIGKGIGLQNIKKRIALINGTHTLTSVINEGTTLQITIAL